jgi:DNA repair ATPase RecN
MIEQLRIKDFQSIEDLDIACGPITVIYGESDTGKSAVVRALYALAFNSYPKGHVRDGAKASEVQVTVDGVQVEAWKGSGENSYMVHREDGLSEQWAKVGADVPAEVTEALGWRVLELDDGSRFAPNFHMQFEPPFLLTDSPSRRAKVLGTLTNVATLYAAIKEANSWERREKQRGDTQQEIVDQAIERIEPLETVIEAEQILLGDLMSILSTAKVVQADLVSHGAMMAKMIGAQETVSTAKAVIKMMDDSDPSAELAKAERLMPKVQGLSALWENIAHGQVAVKEAKETVDRHEEAWAVARSRIEEFQVQYEVCPMCGNSWDGHEDE